MYGWVWLGLVMYGWPHGLTMIPQGISFAFRQRDHDNNSLRIAGIAMGIKPQLPLGKLLWGNCFPHAAECNCDTTISIVVDRVFMLFAQRCGTRIKALGFQLCWIGSRDVPNGWSPLAETFLFHEAHFRQVVDFEL